MFYNSRNIMLAGLSAKNNIETFYAKGSDYAVCFEWSDGNPTKEDRQNRFVQVTDGGNKISFANSTSDICGVTTDTAAFVENYGVNSEYTSLVGILGIVTVIDNGSCAVGECCMSDDSGYAVPSSNNMGYRVMERVDDTKIKIAVKPNDDMIQRIKTDVSNLELTKANTDEVIEIKPYGWTDYTYDFSGNLGELTYQDSFIGGYDCTYTIHCAGETLGFTCTTSKYGQDGSYIEVNGQRLWNNEEVPEDGGVTKTLPSTYMEQDIVVYNGIYGISFSAMQRKSLKGISELKTQIGDIDVALDGIIALQNELAGGGV